MTSSTTLLTKWILLLLVAASVFVYDMTRSRQRGRRLPERLAYAAVILGLVGLLAYQFNLIGNFSDRALSIATTMILGGAAVDLIADFYYKSRTGPDKSSS
jgi:glucan phosphoethanolaminetransferase (alkaline phosphatase superfamily)